MNRCRRNIWQTLPSFLIIILSASLAKAKDDVPQTSALDQNQWEMAGFSESETPIREHPGYRPLQRVLVGSATPELLKSMATNFPGVAFVTNNQIGNEPEKIDAVLLRCSQPQLLSKAINVAWIHTYSAGVDACMAQPQVKKLIAREGGVIVTNSSGTAASVIAEHSIAMMMSMARGLHRFRDTQAESQWQRSLASEPGLMQTVGGKTMLVLGLGSIGQEVAKRAERLGMRVLATRNSSREGPDYVEYVGLSNETIDLAKQADVIVNALPLTEATKGFVDKAFFEAMQSTALYISVGRGGTTDTQALLEALQSKAIAGAALDVTDPEPLPQSHPLWKQENVIITPHISGTGGEARGKAISLVLENLRRYQAGEAMLNVVDTSLGY